jgi:hypothetical protein
MPVIPFIPMIAQGVGMVAGGIAGKKAEKNAMQRSPEEMAALTGATGIAGQAGKMGSELVGESKPFMQQAGQYYQTLLRGNRAAMQGATAPYAAQITDTYRGANRALAQSGVRGAARDVQAGELNRQRASQIAGLTTGMQPMAADALGKLGTAGIQAGAPLMSSAGNIYGNLLNQGAINREYARGEGARTAASIGGAIRKIGEAIPTGGRGRSAYPTYEPGGIDFVGPMKP